jgi:hypothetical protein
MLRRPPARRVAALLVGIVALAGCSVPSNTPESYDAESVEDFFLAGCQGGDAEGEIDPIEVDGSTTTLAGADACRCAFEVFRERVPYDDAAREADPEKFANYGGPTFVELDGDAGSDPAAALDSIPAEIRAEIEACGETGSR